VMAARQSVLVFRELPPDQLARITAVHEVTLANPRRPEQLAAFEAALPQAQGMIGSSYRITEALLAQAPQLRVLSSISAGVDNYPLAALAQRGILLCHTPGVLTETTADTVFALVMATSRRIVELANHVRDGHWSRNIGEDRFGWDVHGKTLGILGFGRIGQAVARRAALGFDMPVLYHARHAADVPTLAGRAVHTPLDALLERADIVVATLPSTATRLGYLSMFGVGSTLGMVALSGLLGWQIARMGSDRTIVRTFLLAVGCISTVLGLFWGYPILTRLL
jgi:Lactate dehydrogenase and related dehydrogenases